MSSSDVSEAYGHMETFFFFETTKKKRDDFVSVLEKQNFLSLQVTLVVTSTVNSALAEMVQNKPFSFTRLHGAGWWEEGLPHFKGAALRIAGTTGIAKGFTRKEYFCSFTFSGSR